jgi:hypothetical protein
LLRSSISAIDLPLHSLYMAFSAKRACTYTFSVTKTHVYSLWLLVQSISFIGSKHLPMERLMRNKAPESLVGLDPLKCAEAPPSGDLYHPSTTCSVKAFLVGLPWLSQVVKRV